MTKAEKFIHLINEKYKLIDFNKIDRKTFERIRAEEIRNYNKLNDDAILMIVNTIAKENNSSINDIKKEFKTAIDRKSYADAVLHAENMIKSGKLYGGVHNDLKAVSKEFGKKMDKLNLDLIVDDKELEKEGFFKKYPHLKK